ncbi:tail fiber protein [Marinicella sp. S1101]|uniref:phage tail protein n=1 Tax=Marinicella marina TaxID=2996016 RepID=UPI002260D772|nr:tail fiber protein [Marinicella marina]MCX7554488.1 tail fiber protein [Marinicella marina]MDJ1140639.1 tail fiber protein [Marinicella marina]
MSEPFLAEIRMVGFNFAPRGWAFCDGQILPINQNQSLYSLLGTVYGGDGRTSFALPDIRGRAPVHVGPGYSQGSKSGEETHTLNTSEMPQHQHNLTGSSDDAVEAEGAGNYLAQSPDENYSNTTANAALGAASMSNAGGGQAHENMQPFIAVNYCIALQGLFPSRN